MSTACVQLPPRPARSWLAQPFVALASTLRFFLLLLLRFLGTVLGLVLLLLGTLLSLTLLGLPLGLPLLLLGLLLLLRSLF